MYITTVVLNNWTTIHREGSKEETVGWRRASTALLWGGKNWYYIGRPVVGGNNTNNNKQECLLFKEVFNFPTEWDMIQF